MRKPGLKSPKYLKWVSSKPCWFCKKPWSDPHHLENKGHTRRYQDFDNVINLCRDCHNKMHDKPLEENKILDKMKKEAVRLTEEYNENCIKRKS